MSEIAFDDIGQIAASTFNPDNQYIGFKKVFTVGLTYDQIRIFFLNGKKAKETLSKRSEETVTLNFGGWRIPIVNTHFPGNRNIDLADDALTLHRVSGYLARYLLEKVLSAQEPEKVIIKTRIINPIAASNGITWDDGYEVYLSFFPGSEMFLEAFKFYPLAIGIYKVQKGMMDVKFLEKTMRQKYAGLDATVWTQQKYTDVINALLVVNGLGWKKSNVSAAAKDFLSKFGIQI
ncbi:nucleocapsid protein [Taiassui virus]|uniref:Nucleoprotein n=2 Tax=Orthobunyavirus wyeomyiae TaxID=3052456 RepID=H6U335_9VIRU|nr:nucleocapsid protein [Taiassui virus]AEZ35272.1 nucleocapsid protein [Tucunduba virus]